MVSANGIPLDFPDLFLSAQRKFRIFFRCASLYPERNDPYFTQSPQRFPGDFDDASRLNFLYSIREEIFTSIGAPWLAIIAFFRQLSHPFFPCPFPASYLSPRVAVTPLNSVLYLQIYFNKPRVCCDGCADCGSRLHS